MTQWSIWCEGSLRHPHGIVATPCLEYPMPCWIPHALLDTSWCLRHLMVGESSADLVGGTPVTAAWVPYPAITSWTPR